MKFKSELVAKDLVKALKDFFPEVSEENPIAIHEPNFKNSNANKYVLECINSGWVSSLGKYVDLFEEKICSLTGAKYAIALTNGTVALRLALYLVGVRTHDEVLIPPISFVATANAVSHLGASPHFIDIESDSFGMDPDNLSNRLDEIAENRTEGVFNKQTNRRIAAIVPVHVFGIPAQIDEIIKIANKWQIPVVEDAAEALGSSKNGIHCGLFGKCGIISFNGNKLITTGGGGALITNDDILAKRCKHLSTTAKINHPWEFDHDQIAWNDRMPNINAALGVSELEKISEKIHSKEILLSKYIEAFKNQEKFEILKEPKDCTWNKWLINLRLNIKNQEEALKIKNAILEISYKEGLRLRPLWKPLNKLKMYQQCQASELIVSEEQSKRLISLPSSPQLIKN